MSARDERVRDLVSVHDDVELAEMYVDAEQELDRLRSCVGLLRPEEAAQFWHLYRTHPYLDRAGRT